jgi:thiol:disulfide interchange protein
MVGAKRAVVFVLALGSSTVCACKRETPLPDGPYVIERVPETAWKNDDVVTVAKHAFDKAKAKNLRTFVELRADWCGPCKKLEAAEDDPLMKDAFTGTYVLRVDVGEAGTKLGPYRSDAIPAFFEVGADGRPTGRTITGGAWAEDTPPNMAPALKSFFRGGTAPAAR